MMGEKELKEEYPSREYTEGGGGATTGVEPTDGRFDQSFPKN